MRAYIGLGSNLGDGPELIKAAIRTLERYDSISIKGMSSLYRTAPWGFEDQADFTNAVAEVETDLEPLELLRLLLKVEAGMGRDRNVDHWGPRVMDLDLLMYGDIALATPELELPHPRMHQRKFVLVPLLELNADVNIPGVGAAQNCLAGVAKQRVEKID